MPKSKIAFWQKKLRGNQRRDSAVLRKLKRNGWAALVIWECQTVEAKKKHLTGRLIRFLGGTPAASQGA